MKSVQAVCEATINININVFHSNTHFNRVSFFSLRRVFVFSLFISYIIVVLIRSLEFLFHKLYLPFPIRFISVLFFSLHFLLLFFTTSKVHSNYPLHCYCMADELKDIFLPLPFSIEFSSISTWWNEKKRKMGNGWKC